MQNNYPRGWSKRQQREEEYKTIEESLALWPAQWWDGWQAGWGSAVSTQTQKATSIVVVGMGGSAYAARWVASFGAIQKKPIVMVNGYQLPAWVNKETAVLVVSYSGSTDEAIVCAKKAHVAGAAVSVLVSGGTLMRWSRATKSPLILLPTKNNPAGQPRLGSGLTFGGVCGTLAKWGVISMTNESAVADKKFLERMYKEMLRQGRAGAKKLIGRTPLLLASGHLESMVFAARNVLNECAKQMAIALPLPEAHHNAFESFERPEEASDTLCGVLFESKKYSPAERKRIAVSRSLFLEMGMPILRVELPSKSHVTDAIAGIWWAGFVGLELARLEQIDAMGIPMVDRVKELM